MQEPVAGDPKPADPTTPPPDDGAQRKAELLAAEQAAYEKARPVFEKWCAKCHQTGGAKATAKKLGHFDMTTYPFKGHHEMEIGAEIREVLGIDGGKPTMPMDRKGAVQGEELALIEQWSRAFDASHAAGAHEGHGGHGGHQH